MAISENSVDIGAMNPQSEKQAYIATFSSLAQCQLSHLPDESGNLRRDILAGLISPDNGILAARIR